MLVTAIRTLYCRLSGLNQPLPSLSGLSSALNHC
jgi:hypothetical protein